MKNKITKKQIDTWAKDFNWELVSDEEVYRAFMSKFRCSITEAKRLLKEFMQ